MSKEEQDIRSSLMKQQKQNMHLDFFYKDISIQYIQVPIFSTANSDKHIIPFRNMSCTSPACVYDTKDIINNFKSDSKKFKCFSCGNYLSLHNFYLDYTLKKIVDFIWKKSQETSTPITFNSIKIKRDGKWEPCWPTNSGTNVRKIFEDGLFRVKGVDVQENSNAIIERKSPPQLSEFTKDEYQELLGKFKKEYKSNSQVVFVENGIEITKKNVDNLVHEDIMDGKMVAIFIDYLNSLHNSEKGNLKESRNRCLFLGVEVLDFDKFDKTTKYRNLTGSREKEKRKPSNTIKDFDKVIIIASYNERWIVGVLELNTSKIHIVDFLTEELSMTGPQELFGMIRYISMREFKLNCETFELYKGEKLPFICDCGYYALNYVYKCLNNDIIENIKVKFSNKDLFRKQLIWLILKLKTIQKNEILFFIPPERTPATSKQDLETPKIPNLYKQETSGSIKTFRKTKYNRIDNVSSPSFLTNFNDELSEIRSPLPDRLVPDSGITSNPHLPLNLTKLQTSMVSTPKSTIFRPQINGGTRPLLNFTPSPRFNQGISQLNNADNNNSNLVFMLNRQQSGHSGQSGESPYHREIPMGINFGYNNYKQSRSIRNYSSFDTSNDSSPTSPYNSHNPLTPKAHKSKFSEVNPRNLRLEESYNNNSITSPKNLILPPIFQSNTMGYQSPQKSQLNKGKNSKRTHHYKNHLIDSTPKNYADLLASIKDSLGNDSDSEDSDNIIDSDEISEFGEIPIKPTNKEKLKKLKKKLIRALKNQNNVSKEMD